MCGSGHSKFKCNVKFFDLIVHDYFRANRVHSMLRTNYSTTFDPIEKTTIAYNFPLVIKIDP